MSAEVPALNPSDPPKGIFPPEIERELYGLIRQDREDLVPHAFQRLEFLGKVYDTADESARQLAAEQSYDTFVKRYLTFVVPGVIGSMVGTVMEKPQLITASLLFILGACTVGFPRILRETNRPKLDPKRQKASEFLQGVISNHPGKPQVDEDTV